VKNALIVDDTFGDFEAGFAIAAIIGHTWDNVELHLHSNTVHIHHDLHLQ